MISMIIVVVKGKLLSIIRKMEVLLLKRKEISTQTCQKRIKEQKLNIKKKNASKLKNLTIFLTSIN